jgi:enhancing lycopene biosynthesis protein 2
MNIGVVLSGCGVYDGSEIHEAVSVLLSIEQNGGDYICYAPDIEQHHVVNHKTGEETQETRNVLVEAARIARGNISNIATAKPSLLDALVIPGGFGAAKNLTKWAFEGPDGDINSELRKLIIDMIAEGKPIVGLCMGPTVIAKAVEGTISLKLTVGTTKESSPYDIEEVNQGIIKTGSSVELCSINQICYDEENRVITAPCYMMDASVLEVYNNTKMAIDKLFEILNNEN